MEATNIAILAISFGVIANAVTSALILGCIKNVSKACRLSRHDHSIFGRPR